MAIELIETSSAYGRAVVVEPPFVSWSELGGAQTAPAVLVNRILRAYYVNERVFPVWSSIFMSAYLLNPNFPPALSRPSHQREGRNVLYFFVPGIEAGSSTPMLQSKPFYRFIRQHRTNQFLRKLELRGFHQGLPETSGLLGLANNSTSRS